MKPTGWDEMSPPAKRDYAERLFASTRGQYLIGQALTIASDRLKTRPHPYKEVSNAEDMEVLEVLFFPFRKVKGMSSVAEDMLRAVPVKGETT